MKEENKKDMLKRLLFIAKKLSEKTKEQSKNKEKENEKNSEKRESRFTKEQEEKNGSLPE